MERIVRVHIEKLPEGVYLATSDDIQGLVAREDSFGSVEIARDVARKLLETQKDPKTETELEPVADNFDYPLLVAT